MPVRVCCAHASSFFVCAGSGGWLSYASAHQLWLEHSRSWHSWQGRSMVPSFLWHACGGATRTRNVNICCDCWALQSSYSPCAPEELPGLCPCPCCCAGRACARRTPRPSSPSCTTSDPRSTLPCSPDCRCAARAGAGLRCIAGTHRHVLPMQRRAELHMPARLTVCFRWWRAVSLQGSGWLRARLLLFWAIHLCAACAASRGPARSAGKAHGSALTACLPACARAQLCCVFGNMLTCVRARARVCVCIGRGPKLSLRLPRVCACREAPTTTPSQAWRARSSRLRLLSSRPTSSKC